MGRCMPANRPAVAKASSGSSSTPKWAQDELRSKHDAYQWRPDILKIKNRYQAEHGLPLIVAPSHASSAPGSSTGAQKKKKQLSQTKWAKMHRAAETGISTKATPLMNKISQAASQRINEGGDGLFEKNQKRFWHFHKSDEWRSGAFALDKSKWGRHGFERCYWNAKIKNPFSLVAVTRGPFFTVYGYDTAYCAGINGIKIKGSEHLASITVHCSRMQEFAIAVTANQPDGALDLFFITRDLMHDPSTSNGRFDGWGASALRNVHELEFFSSFLKGDGFCRGQEDHIEEIFRISLEELVEDEKEMTEEQEKAQMEERFLHMIAL